MSSSTPLYQRAFWRTIFSVVSGRSVSSSSRHRCHQDAPGGDGVAQGRVLGGPRGGEAPEVAQQIEAHKLVVPETDLRTSARELEERSQDRGQARGAGRHAGEPAYPPGLVDEPCDRNADEDRRLLDRAHPPLHGQRFEVGQGERDPLVGHAPADRRHDVGGDPAVHVAIGHRVGIAHADEDPARIVVLTQQSCEVLGPERPVQLMRLTARDPAW